MTQPTTSGFFSGGGKAIQWPQTPGGLNQDGSPNGRTQVSGTITAIHPPEEIMTIATPTKPSVPTGKFQVRITLATNERDGEDDDGARTLYVKSWMRTAVGKALQAHGLKEPEIGGKLTVVFTRLEPSQTPGLNPSKIFEAFYEKAPVTGGYFNGQQSQQAPAQQQFPQQTTVQAPQQQAPQAGAMYPMQQPQQQAQPEPQRPPAISEQAWAQMDAATRQAVANTMTGLNSPGQPGF